MALYKEVYTQKMNLLMTYPQYVKLEEAYESGFIDDDDDDDDCCNEGDNDDFSYHPDSDSDDEMEGEEVHDVLQVPDVPILELGTRANPIVIPKNGTMNDSVVIEEVNN